MGRDHSYMDEAFRSRRFDPTDRGTYVRDLVFVIMAFSDDMDRAYESIRDECRKMGLTAKRADDGVGSGIILREITDSIEKAELLICDLTHQRPNVYYELGYAHGVGNESSDILLIAREGTVLHFDIAPLRVQFYRDEQHLRTLVARNIPGMLQRSRQGL